MSKPDKTCEWRFAGWGPQEGNKFLTQCGKTVTGHHAVNGKCKLCGGKIVEAE